MPTLLMIDNYDSFTFNLVQMFRQYSLDVRVMRSDAIDLGGVSALAPDYIVLSPGPKDPAHAGICVPLVRALHRELPILGVCLGMQCINEAFGGRTIRSPKPLHGRASAVYHENMAVFQGIPSPMRAARYHSLAVQPDPSALDESLMITARAADGIIMGLSHRRYPLHGIQFHPESFMTEHGFELIENFLTSGALIDFNGCRYPR